MAAANTTFAAAPTDARRGLPARPIGRGQIDHAIDNTAPRTTPPAEASSQQRWVVVFIGWSMVGRAAMLAVGRRGRQAKGERHVRHS